MTALTPTDAAGIPDDIKRAAHKAIWDTGRGMIGRERNYLEYRVQRAILAERQRCIAAAQEAGNFGDYRREELTADFGRPRFDMMNEIISAIRNPHSLPSPSQATDMAGAEFPPLAAPATHPPFAAPAVPHATTPSSESPEGEAQSLSGEPIQRADGGADITMKHEDIRA